MSLKLLGSLIFCLLVSTSLVFGYYPGESVRIPALYTENGIPTTTYSNISIYSPLDVLLVDNVGMTVDQIGLSHYDFTFPSTLGDYTVLVNFYNTSWDLQGSVSDVLPVVFNYDEEILEELQGELPESTLTANDTTFDYHCPAFARVNETFTVFGDYEYALNSSDVLLASVNISNSTNSYNLTYNSGNSRYEDTFISTIPLTWAVNISADKGDLENYTYECIIEIGEEFGLNVRLWEEVELKTEYQNNNYILTAENYDKQLTDPYINDFAYIIAVNNDHNSTTLYDYCNLPLGSFQGLTDSLGSILGDNLTKLFTNSLQDYDSCNRYWFHGAYDNGIAYLALPWIGNYSLYLLEGDVTWENEYAPPQITKSNLFMDLGQVFIPERKELTLDMYISHDELDFWASFTDGIFLFMAVILPIIIFFGLTFIGFPIQLAGLFVISYETIWLIMQLF